MSNAPFRVYLVFHGRDSPENSHLALTTRVLQTIRVWSKSVIIWGHITCGAVYRFGFTSVIMGGILLKTHTSNSPRMRYKRSKFGSDRSFFKGTLLLEQCAFSSVFLEGLSWKDAPRTLHACARDVACCDPSLMTLYLENDVPFRLNRAFHWRDFPKKSIPLTF